MEFGSIYFKLLVVSGVVSCTLGIVFWKDLWDKGVSTTWVIVQSMLFLWFCVFTAKLLSTGGPVRGLADALVTVITLVVIAFLHAPLVVSVLGKLSQDALEGMIDPKSALVVKKSYDEAERAEARHDYDRALELYREERERDPEDSHVRIKIGNLLAGRHRFEEAVVELSGILDMEAPEEKDVVYGSLRAAEILHMNLNHTAGARHTLARALERDLSEEARKAIESRLPAYS
jgi:hypothetical protein